MCESNYVAFWKRQNRGNSNKTSGYQRLGEGGMNQKSIKDLGDSEIILYYTRYCSGECMSLYICPNA